MSVNSEIELLNTVAQVIYDKKGFNIIAIDVRNLSTITDYLVIAEGNVDRHVSAIARALETELKAHGENLLHEEGLENGDWVVLDFGRIMVHLFMPGLREAYSLERLWKDAKIVDLQIETGTAETQNAKSGTQNYTQTT